MSARIISTAPTAPARRCRSRTSRSCRPTGRRSCPSARSANCGRAGPQIVKGYWNKPEASAATFVDGWVRTGDLARLDEEGFLYIVDRAKDMVIRGGENIYSIEVENVLFDHPAVTDAALIGLPHRTLGEEPAAVVHLAPGASATEEELKAWVRERLAVFKTPVRIAFLPQPLPRNANGKILKQELRPSTPTGACSYTIMDFAIPIQSAGRRDRPRRRWWRGRSDRTRLAAPRVQPFHQPCG